jgi:hypothetical protein
MSVDFESRLGSTCRSSRCSSSDGPAHPAQRIRRTIVCRSISARGVFMSDLQTAQGIAVHPQFAAGTPRDVRDAPGHYL